jgi:hypothetical protein
MARYFGSRRELVAVLVVSSTCEASRTPGLPAAIRAMTQRVARQAGGRGASFATLGVAVDWHPDEGMKFLRRFGPLDEVVTGRSWLNRGVLEFLWRDRLARAALPQLIIAERQVDVSSSSVNTSSDRVLLRRTGAREIMAWVDSGAVLPTEGPGERR